MSEIRFGERIRTVRKNAGCSQKEFCSLLDIPQSTLSAYETDRMQPTVASLVNIATKFNVSLDWLCGIEKTAPGFGTMGEALDAVYNLTEVEGLKIDFTVNDHLPNDVETPTERWFVQMTVYGNDSANPHNADFCKGIRQIADNISDLESYSISTETYETEKEKAKNYYNQPLTKKDFPELSREERQKKHIEWVKQHLKDE